MKAYIIGIVCLVVILLFLNIPQNAYKKYSLQKTYKILSELSDKNDCHGQYKYILPSEKIDLKENDFVLLCQNQNRAMSHVKSLQINSIKINGDEGLIDRTLVVCLTADCTGKNRAIDNRIKRYFYVNGKWYNSLNNSTVYCQRTEPYSMPAEFQRVLSLIIQRLDNTQSASGTTFEQENKASANLLKKIQNCLNIQYASVDNDLNGAEGVFYFDKNSTNEDLKILVSPKYQIKDDLLTATVLRHEIEHVLNHVGGLDKMMSCYQNEANAFAMEIGFYLSALNQEERNSINSRYNSSLEAKNLIDLSNYNIKSGNKFISENMMSYVMNNPFYKKQCADDK